jgi:hypothetical protein
VGPNASVDHIALAARPEDYSHLHDDVGTMDYFKGSVRGRTLRLGKTTPFMPGALSATGFAGMGRELRPGPDLRLTPPWNWQSKFSKGKSTGLHKGKWQIVSNNFIRQKPKSHKYYPGEGKISYFADFKDFTPRKR